MFMTLKCGSNEDSSEMQHLHATDRMGRPTNTSHVACNSCRKKKLLYISNTMATASMQPRDGGMSSVPTARHTMCV
ncbi:hypothetical protein LY76DRAFT_619785 [Colletotrichum caudatum]|nr:hypothetical protein LY76DRAFT_619785 [Colletotrichum caudatum]